MSDPAGIGEGADLKSRAVRGLVWSGVQSWSSQAGSLLVFLVLARLLRPEDFGVMALAVAVLTIASILVEQGLVPALVQRESLDEGHLDTAFWLHAALGVVLCAAMFLAAGPVAGVLDAPQLEPVLRGLSPVPLIHGLGFVLGARFRRRLAYRELAVGSLFAITGSAVVGIGMALSGFGVFSLVGQQVAFDLLRVASMWWHDDWRPGKAISLASARELAGFGGPILGSQMVVFLGRRADYLLVGLYLGEHVLGLYAFAHRILEVMGHLLVSTISSVVTAALARIQGERERLAGALERVLRLHVALSFPCFLGVAATAPDLVLVLFGAQWEAAVVVVRILCLAGITWALTALMESALIATGRPGAGFAVTLVTALVNVTACAVAVHHGVVAVAVAWVAAQLLAFPIWRWSVGRELPVRLADALRGIAKPLLAAGMMVIVVVAAREWSDGVLARPALLVLAIVVGAGAYVLTIRFLAPDLSRELASLARSARKRG